MAATTGWPGDTATPSASSFRSTPRSCCLLAAAGQAYVHVLTRADALAFFVDSQRARDLSLTLTLTRRLVSVVVTDACCWLLVALWAVLDAQGVLAPGQVVSWMSLFFVFFSSAVTPYLYLLNVLLERRQEVQKQRLLKRLGYKVADITCMQHDP